MVTKCCKDSNFLVQLETTLVANSDSGESFKELPIHEQSANSSINVTAKSCKDISTVLAIIREPQKWSENGKTFETRLSCKPATRSDVTNLCKTFDGLLVKRRAKVDGICPTRRGLYSQLFDELIRQVCLIPQSIERGLFLVKIRDEYIMTLKSYEALLSSSVNVFAQNSINSAQKIKRNLTKTITAIEMESKYLRKNVQELETEHDQAHQMYTDLKRTLEDKHLKKIENLKQTNMQLTLHLDAMIDLKNKQPSTPA